MYQLHEYKNPGKVTVALFKYVSMRVIGDKSTRWPNILSATLATELIFRKDFSFLGTV